MKADFQKLTVGSMLETRESKGDPWYLVKVTKIDGEDIYFEDEYGATESSYKEEVEGGIFFRNTESKDF